MAWRARPAAADFAVDCYYGPKRAGLAYGGRDTESL